MHSSGLMQDFEETASMCMCLLHSLNRGRAHDIRKPGKTEITRKHMRNTRCLAPWGLIFARDTRVTFKLQLFIYACVCTILFLCSTFFHVCVPSQTSICECIPFIISYMDVCPNGDTFIDAYLHTHAYIL